MFEWVQELLSKDLKNVALAELKSKMMAYFLKSPSSEMLINGKKELKEKLKNNDIKLGNAQEIADAKECIVEFKNLKGQGEKGNRTYDFNFLDNDQKLLKNYKALAQKFNNLQKARINGVFMNTFNSVEKLLISFNNSCLAAIEDLDYKKASSKLIRECNGITSEVKELFKKYIQQKTVSTAADVAKYYFAVCSIESNKDQSVGFVGRALSNTLQYTLEKLREKCAT